MGDLARANSLYSEGKYSMALEIYESLSRRGNFECSRMCGVMYLLSLGVEYDLEKSIGYLEEAVLGDSAESFFWLAKAYAYRSDFDLAVKNMEISSDKGYVPAIYCMGYFFRQGLGVTADIDIAERYFRSAAKKGNIHGMIQLSRLQMRSTNYLTKGKGALNWVKGVSLTLFCAFFDQKSDRLIK